MQFLKTFGVISSLAASVAALPVAAPVYQVETSTVTVVEVQPQPGTYSTAGIEVVSGASPTAVAATTSIPFPSNVPTSTVSASAAPSATATAAGGVHVVNNMEEEIYLWSVSAESGDMQTLNALTGHYQEGWQTNLNGGGISVKMSTSPSDTGSVLQFEYTWEGETIWWDLSSINLDPSSPFVKHGFTVIPDSDDCAGIQCAPGVADCSASYQHPNDIATHSCASNTAFTLRLGQADSSKL